MTHAQPTTAQLVLSALQAYGLKEEGADPKGGQRYRCNSPLRPGSNSHAFTVIIKDDEHGAWHDKVSEEKGSLYQLAELLGLREKKEDAPTTKRPYEGLDDYAQAHYIPADVLRAAGWKEARWSKRPALAFPTAHGTRYRLLDGGPDVYIQERGYRPCLYGLDRAARLASETGQPLVLCNGEVSTVCAQHRGVAAFAQNMGEKNLTRENLEALLAAYPAGQAIIIALDCDKRGRDASRGLLSQLTEAGYVVRAVDLGGGFGFDLADFCALHEQESAEVLRALPDLDQTPPAPAAVAAPSVTWLTEDALERIPRPTFLFRDLIVAGEINVLYGGSGGGKTFWAIDASMSTAVESGLAVGYVAAEDAPGVKTRKNAWRHFHKESRGTFLTWPEPVNLMDRQQVDQFIAQSKTLGLGLIIFDTLAWCMIGADENSSKDMGIALESCRRIKTETGAAILIIHHTDKAGQAERGSSALRGAAYMMLQLTNDDGQITLTCEKAKNSKPFPPRSYQLVETTIVDEGESEQVPVMLPSDQVENRFGAPLQPRQIEVLKLLSMDIFAETGLKAADIASTLNLPKKSAYRALESLKRLYYLEQGTKGDPFKITFEGRAALEEVSQANINNHAQVSPVSVSVNGVSDTRKTQVSECHPVSPLKGGDTGDTLDTDIWVDPVDTGQAVGDYALDEAYEGYGRDAMETKNFALAERYANSIKGRRRQLALLEEIDKARRGELE